MFEADSQNFASAPSVCCPCRSISAESSPPVCHVPLSARRFHTKELMTAKYARLCPVGCVAWATNRKHKSGRGLGWAGSGLAPKARVPRPVHLHLAGATGPLPPVVWSHSRPDCGRSPDYTEALVGGRYRRARMPGGCWPACALQCYTSCCDLATSLTWFESREGGRGGGGGRVRLRGGLSVPGAAGPRCLPQPDGPRKGGGIRSMPHSQATTAPSAIQG